MELRRTAQAILRTPFFNASSHRSGSSRIGSSRPFRDLTQNRDFRGIAQFSTTSHRRKQAAARREEPDEDEDEDPQPARHPKKSRRGEEPEEPIPTPDEPLEPSQRVLLSQKHTTAPPAPPKKPKVSAAARADRSLEFLQKPNAATSKPTATPAPRPGSQDHSQQPTRSSTAFSPRAPIPGAGGHFNFLRSNPKPSTSASSPTGTMSPQSQRDPKTSATSSIDELIQGMTSGQPGQESTPYHPTGPRSTNISQMQRPYAPTPTPETLARVAREHEARLKTAMEAPGFRIGPSLGRTVNVDTGKGMDVARAFTMVNVKCAANQVRQDFNSQRFFERAGVKRKRLTRVRWRRRFKEAFKATVRRVEDMRRKGW